MRPTRWIPAAPAVLLIGALLASCDSDPVAPSSGLTSSSVTGTVLFAGSGAAAAGIQVTMEQCAEGGPMMGGMMHEDWEHARHMTTDHNGRFHFDYMHDHEHRYRLRADGMNPDGMCDLEGDPEEQVTLRIRDD